MGKLDTIWTAVQVAASVINTGIAVDEARRRRREDEQRRRADDVERATERAELAALRSEVERLRAACESKASAQDKTTGGRTP